MTHSNGFEPATTIRDLSARKAIAGQQKAPNAFIQHVQLLVQSHGPAAVVVGMI